MTRVVVSRQSRELADVFALILRYHSEGLAVLIGEHPWITTEELYIMLGGGSGGGMDNERVQGGEPTPLAQKIVEKVERIEKIIERSGGERKITWRFRKFKRECADDWAFLVEATRVMTRNRFSLSKLSLSAAADKHNVSVRTYTRRRLTILLSLAGDILYRAD